MPDRLICIAYAIEQFYFFVVTGNGTEGTVLGVRTAGASEGDRMSPENERKHGTGPQRRCIAI
ncbi:MAG: hypothetical protein BWK76_20330, partial [Desulfobulbaceae bacterium A2]